jgi:hypothetical protein
MVGAAEAAACHHQHAAKLQRRTAVVSNSSCGITPALGHRGSPAETLERAHEQTLLPPGLLMGC